MASLKTGLSNNRISWAQSGGRLVGANGYDPNFTIQIDRVVTPHGIYAPTGAPTAQIILPQATSSAAEYTLTIRGTTVTNALASASVAHTASASYVETGVILNTQVQNTRAPGDGGSQYLELYMGRNQNKGLLRFDLKRALTDAAAQFTASSAVPFPHDPDEFLSLCTEVELSLAIDKTNSKNIDKLPTTMTLYPPLVDSRLAPNSLPDSDLTQWEVNDLTWQHRANYSDLPTIATAGTAELWQGVHREAKTGPQGRLFWGYHPLSIPLPSRQEADTAFYQNEKKWDPPMLGQYDETIKAGEFIVPATASAGGLPDAITFSGDQLLESILFAAARDVPFCPLLMQSDGNNAWIRLFGATAPTASTRPSLALTYVAPANIVGEGVVGLLKGSYIWAYTYYDETHATESDLSPPTPDGLQVSERKVKLSGFTPPQTEDQARLTHVRLYRTLNGGSVLYLVDTIPLPKTGDVVDLAADGTVDLEYTDNVSDDILAGRAVAPSRNGKPPNAKFIAAGRNRIHMLAAQSYLYPYCNTEEDEDSGLVNILNLNLLAAGDGEASNDNGRGSFVFVGGTANIDEDLINAKLVVIGGERFENYTIVAVDPVNLVVWLDRAIPNPRALTSALVFADVFPENIIGRKIIIDDDGIYRTVTGWDTDQIAVYFDPPFGSEKSTNMKVIWDEDQVYWTEPNGPEYWHYSNQHPIGLDDGDVFTGLRLFRDNWYYFKQNHLYQHAYGLDPNPITGDGEIRLVSSTRGAASMRCIVEVYEWLIVLDRHGIYRFNGYDLDHVSRPVDSIINALDWTKAERFHAVHHRQGNRHQVRFFVCRAGESYPQTEIVWDYRDNTWTINSYRQEMHDSLASEDSNDVHRSFVSDGVKHLLALDVGALDAVPHNNGTVRGTITGYSAAFGLAASAATFYTTGNGLVGAFCQYQDQNSEWQWFRIISNGANTLRPSSVLTGSNIPKTGGSFRVGPIPVAYKTAIFALGSPGFGKKLQTIYIYYRPKATNAKIKIRLWLDMASAPFENWADDLARDGFTITEDEAAVQLDMGYDPGVIKLRPPGQAFRYIQLEIIDDGATGERFELIGIEQTYIGEERK